LGFSGGSDGKESACNVGDLGSIPGLGRSPRGGHGNPLTEALILFLGDTEADSFSQMLFCFYNHKKLKWTE